MLILDFIQKGGAVMWPLFFVAILASYLIIAKGWHVLRLSIRYRRLNLVTQIRNLLKEKDYDAARALLKDHGPSEKILDKGIHYLEEQFQEEAIKDRLEMIYDEEMHQLERGLPFILILGEIMPMLGLLGTVSGMIQVFKAISSYGTGDAQALASGISEALLTTEVGLVLAIPTMFFYTAIQSQIDSLAKNMRHAGAAIVTISRVINKSTHV